MQIQINQDRFREIKEIAQGLKISAGELLVFWILQKLNDYKERRV